MSPILTAPDAILRQLAKPVEKLDKKVLGIIDDMVATLKAAKNPEGVGLAAPQIGIPLRIFLIRPLPDTTITVFINPEITKFSQRRQSHKTNKGIYEGCLSLPGHYAPVTRSMSVTVKYQTLTANPKSEILNPKIVSPAKRSYLEFSASNLTEKVETFSGFPAHIIQHELDHLNGLLFIDRVLEQNIKLYQVAGDSWAEVAI